MAEQALPLLGHPLAAGSVRFGTDGIRGRVGSVITPALALQLGYWCGRVLPQQGPILLGSDSRSSGPMLVAALAAGLTAAGRDVLDLGLCPTPAVPGAIRALGGGGGLMVSASHNPPHDNGIKVFGACGAKLARTEQAAIEAGLTGASPALEAVPANGRLERRPDLLEAYRQRLLASVGEARLEGCRVVLDLCWGSATSCGEALFRELRSRCCTASPMARASIRGAAAPTWSRCGLPCWPRGLRWASPSMAMPIACSPWMAAAGWWMAIRFFICGARR